MDKALQFGEVSAAGQCGAPKVAPIGIRLLCVCDVIKMSWRLGAAIAHARADFKHVVAAAMYVSVYESESKNK